MEKSVGRAVAALVSVPWTVGQERDLVAACVERLLLEAEALALHFVTVAPGEAPSAAERAAMRMYC
jgi:hypothetical protein